MPYPANIYFNPTDRFKLLWSLVPQVRTLTVSENKTKSLYSSISPAIPIFYVLMVLAIIFDIYLGFSILAKQGVNLGVVIGSVLFDFFLAVFPFLAESIFFKKWNHIEVENKIFLKTLESKARKVGESDNAFE